MKIYRIWEVEENLSKNPKLKFKTKLKNGNALARCYDGYINFIDELNECNIDYYANELNDLNREWFLVQKPVDFMTAINSGKDIRSEYWDTYKSIRGTINCLDKYDNATSELQVINGKWYVRED